jgi:hypothetical protein
MSELDRRNRHRLTAKDKQVSDGQFSASLEVEEHGHAPKYAIVGWVTSTRLSCEICRGPDIGEQHADRPTTTERLSECTQFDRIDFDTPR